MDERRINTHCNVSEHDRRLENIEKTVNDIYHRLFVSNGKQSIIDQLNRHEQFFNVVTRIIWIGAVPVIGGLIGFMWWGITVYAKQ